MQSCKVELKKKCLEIFGLIYLHNRNSILVTKVCSFKNISLIDRKSDNCTYSDNIKFLEEDKKWKILIHSVQAFGKKNINS